MNKVPASINIQSISEYHTEINKARPYIRTRRGKLQRVKGYVGRPSTKRSLQPEKQTAAKAFEKRLDEYKKKLTELEAWDVKKEPLAHRRLPSFVKWMNGRIDNYRSKVKQLEARIADLGGKVTSRPTPKPEAPVAPVVPVAKEIPKVPDDLIELKTKEIPKERFYKPTSAQIDKVKKYVMESDLTDYESPREQIKWIGEVSKLANEELFDGQLKNIKCDLLSFKSKRCLGQYNPNWGNISINPRYFMSNKNLEAMHETIVHELCHKATRELQGISEGNAHGWAWQQWMNRVGLVASRLNYHDIDIATPEEKKDKTREEQAKTGETLVESWNLRSMQLVKFNNKGRWITAKLVKQMSSRDRWWVTTPGGNTWRVSANHMYKLSPKEEEEANKNFGGGLAVENTTKLINDRAARRRQRKMYRRGLFGF
jgi:hypothetical protein